MGEAARLIIDWLHLLQNITLENSIENRKCWRACSRPMHISRNNSGALA